MKPKRSVDLTTGPIFKKLLLFTLPLLATNLLQHFYHAADQVIVGNFASNGKDALAAIGSTVSATNLLINLFVGLAVGANILCANLRGGKKENELRETMHTCLVLAAIFGIVVSVIGQLITRPLIQLMNCPADVFELAVLYVRIIFCGTPFSMVYNFAGAMIRANGDTRRPMMILSVSGLINVALNLIFVICFHMSVEGVALATIISQVISCVRALKILFDPKDEFRMKFKELKLHASAVKAVLRVGVPCGINSSVFSLSNAVAQSAMNTFSSAAVAGGAAATSLITLTYQILVAFYSGCVSFAGQCYGAQNYTRIRKLVGNAMLLAVGSVTLLATVFTFFYGPAISIYNSDPEVIATGKVKLIIVSWSYLPYAVSEVFLGCLRGMKRSAIPTAINVLCVCAIRVFWVIFIFPLRQTSLEWLCLCYPVSYISSAVLMALYYIYTIRKVSAEPKESIAAT